MPKPRNMTFLRYSYLISACLLLSIVTSGAAQPTLFPQPQEVSVQQGSHTFKKKTQLYLDNSLPAPLKKIIIGRVTSMTGHAPTLVSSTQDATLTFSIASGQKHPEGYTLRIDKKNIHITAQKEAGLFYALQTLTQLSTNNSLPLVKITDFPAYQWRGMHLDVSRHFYDVAFIKRYLDLMALYKLNVFHWHLSDDDGWRIESKKFPKLTKIGSSGSRSGKTVGGGYYTQDQVKEIIAYAAARQIQVLPEIDVPGHSAAIIKAYPNLGAGHDVLNIGKKETITFLEELFSEIATLFPFGYVHIGCDEVGHGAWRKNPDCQAKMKELNTNDTHVLHRWLVHHLQKHLASENKKAIAWCEVLDAKVDKETVVMCWRDNGGWIKAPKLGHNIVVTPSMQTYFNYHQDLASDAPGHGGYRTTIEKVFRFNPTDASLSTEEKKLVLGGQGCIWTEYISTPEECEYILFPRMIALSEALWTATPARDFSEFQSRLIAHYPFLDKLKVNYRVPAPEPPAKAITFNNGDSLTLKTPDDIGKIRYTTDNSPVTANSLRYQDGIPLSKNVTIKAVTFWPNGRHSYTTTVICKKKEPIRHNGLNITVHTKIKYPAKHAPEKLFDGNSDTWFWSSHSIHPEHTLTFILVKPKKLSELTITTGKNGRDILQSGQLEVSQDGKSFHKVADFTGGIATTQPAQLTNPIKAIRITPLQAQNTWLIIRDLTIK